MGWKITIAIGVFALLILFGVINVEKFIPDRDRTTEQVSSVAPGITGSTVINENEVNINIEQSFFEFEGYMPGKTEIGTFNDWGGKVLLIDDKPTGIEMIIQTDSVETGKEMLNGHLKNDDFFDVEKYPEITFVSNNMLSDTMAGTLTFRGVEKQVSFPITVTDNSISSEFFLDTTEFDFKYIGVNKEVRINFNVVY